LRKKGGFLGGDRRKKGIETDRSMKKSSHEEREEGTSAIWVHQGNTTVINSAERDQGETDRREKKKKDFPARRSEKQIRSKKKVGVVEVRERSWTQYKK